MIFVDLGGMESSRPVLTSDALTQQQQQQWQHRIKRRSTSTHGVDEHTRVDKIIRLSTPIVYPQNVAVVQGVQGRDPFPITKEIPL